MTQSNPWWLLKRVRFLAELDKDALGEVASSVLLHRYQKGGLVFAPAAPADVVFVLLSGLVKVARIHPDSGKELILYLAGPGEPFGVIPFFDDRTGRRVATALRASKVATIERRVIEPLLRRPETEDAILRLVASRGRRLEERLFDLAFNDVPHRLANLLLQLADQFPKERSCGRGISVWLSQQHLGNFIGATREMTSLTINEFKRNGWLATHGRTLCIHDVSALESFVG